MKAINGIPWVWFQVYLLSRYTAMLSCSLSHVWFFVTLWTVAHQDPLSMGILQARILEWVAISFSRGSSQPRDWAQISRIAGGFFTIWATREALIHCAWLFRTQLLRHNHESSSIPPYSLFPYSIHWQVLWVLSLWIESQVHVLYPISILFLTTITSFLTSTMVVTSSLIYLSLCLFLIPRFILYSFLESLTQTHMHTHRHTHIETDTHTHTFPCYLLLKVFL